MIIMDDLKILAQIREYLDDAGHCISDQNWQKAVGRLQDVKKCIETLQDVCSLPSACREGFREIWK